MSTLVTDPSFNGPLAKRNVDKALKALYDNGWWSVQTLAKSIGATETSTSSALEGNISEYRLESVKESNATLQKAAS